MNINFLENEIRRLETEIAELTDKKSKLLSCLNELQLNNLKQGDPNINLGVEKYNAAMKEIFDEPCAKQHKCASVIRPETESLDMERSGMIHPTKKIESTNHIPMDTLKSFDFIDDNDQMRLWNMMNERREKLRQSQV
jgi:hypothetical protein